MDSKDKKTKSFEVDCAARTARRSTPHFAEKTYIIEKPTGEGIRSTRVYETTLEESETRQVLVEAAQSFIDTIEFYKADHGGGKTHEEAVEETLKVQEWRRECVSNLIPADVTWGHVAAVAEVKIEEAVTLWARVREAADDELASGKRGAKVAGENTSPYSVAQYLAIRDSFADQWQPRGGIEAAMIEMLSVAFSLQMYWSTVAHDRALRVHDAQREQLQRYESRGWKESPYQSEADAIDQAQRLADGYNRQFLRVLVS